MAYDSAYQLYDGKPTNNATLSGTQAFPSGSNRIGFITISRGYNVDTGEFPSSITYGGQTISVAHQSSTSFANSEEAVYIAYESDISAMSDGSWSLVLGGTGGSTVGVHVHLTVFTDVTQTLSDSGFNDFTGPDITLNSGVASGDLVFAWIAGRYGETASYDSGTTEWSGNSGNPSPGSTDTVFAAGYQTAASSSESVTFTQSGAGGYATFAAAMTPSGGSSPTLSPVLVGAGNLVGQGPLVGSGPLVH